MSPVSMKTPGVYLIEESAFPNSLIPVQTNVVAFIGYTQKAVDPSGHSLSMKPTKISSLAQFITAFGGAPDYKFGINEVDAPGDFVSAGKVLGLVQDPSTAYLLYNCIRLFYANGGSDCYIVSVGSYSDAISLPQLTAGLSALEKTTEPSLLAVPDAVLLSQNDCSTFQQAMITHCSVITGNCFAILDIWQGYKKRTYAAGDVINAFRDGIGPNGLSYAAAYYPWVNTSIIKPGEISFINISNIDALQNALDESLITLNLSPAQTMQLQATITSMSVAKSAEVASIHQTLMASVPLYASIISIIGKRVGCLPPASAMAGVYTLIDNTRGVWIAPANTSLTEVTDAAVPLSTNDQTDLNVPLNGKAINAIRLFQGAGVLVWGARTLDGNSQDLRYIHARRVLIYIEQSIKNGLMTYASESNAANTWIAVKSAITSFLNDLWKNGGLIGAKASDAFLVEVGLGTTMTPRDVLDGLMRVSVCVAVTHPAELIGLTFQQQMPKS